MIKIKNWEKWQSYRKDRGTPPWIKIHRNLMSNPEWAVLSDSEKGQLVSMWIVAADKGGVIPADKNIIRKICQLDEAPNVNKFIELGFLDADMTPTCQPNDALETETETETETESIPKKTKPRKKTPIVEIGYIPPEWIPLDTWNGFLEHRNDIKAKFSVKAQELTVKKLDKWRTKGHDITEILNNSIMNGWKGVFEPKGNKSTSSQNRYMSAAARAVKNMEET